VTDALDPDAVAEAVAHAEPEVIVHQLTALSGPMSVRDALERAVTSVEWGEGLALRYGGFYGPGTSISLAADAVMAAPIRKRRFPIVGDGGGVFSQIHIDDAAAATAIAVELGQPGIYNVVDDDPAPIREWLPVLANALGAKPPRLAAAISELATGLRPRAWLGR
jgi:nucleoside-diphosphate-sugar epimerase